MKRRVHSREFKLEIARQVTSGEKRPAQLCREHNLSNSVLDRWPKAYEQRGGSFHGAGADRTRSFGTQDSRIRALLWAIGLGEYGVKKSLTIASDRGATHRDYPSASSHA
jgi:putative transposase